MSETTTPATELASQYIAQVTGDLDANVKEQERVSAEIASLQEQLAALQRDHGVLVSMHQALGITAPPTESASDSPSAVVPSPRRKKDGAAAGGKQKARTSAAPAKRAARKSAAKTTSSAKAAGTTKAAATAKSADTTETAGSTKTAAGAAKSGEPTLVELIRRHLAAQKEPRSAAEISTALGQAHPHRDIAAKVVRVTLEGLVAKSQAERSKQGRSVFYTAPAAQSAAAPEAGAQTEDSDS
ncbi:hypothetical protein SAMN06272771_0135 [Streptomyces sp. Ag82_O1-12]|uniref:hypothetical protein n=1 Tax=unclassified Streptomyces TaxID=2593676 RepID=UPI000BC78626|nr:MULTISPECIES: hypothetical protein [unclassified Streptomyces]SMQ13857.1 hypothetical protein SAMN06272771_0135 [Streptomyces sp. Ag82_O1-12]SOD42887.1 hypothetical protein SAMN06272727_0125 [Streptomyces sp. Ag82_G6-1]